MTFEDFDKIQAKLLLEVAGMGSTKGKEYANSVSRFANFDRPAEKNGVSRLVVANIFLTKHLDAIDSFIKNGKIFSTEGIHGRIVDAITYLTLIDGMIREDEINVNLVKEPYICTNCRNGSCNTCMSPKKCKCKNHECMCLCGHPKKYHGVIGCAICSECKVIYETSAGEAKFSCGTHRGEFDPSCSHCVMLMESLEKRGKIGVKNANT